MLARTLLIPFVAETALFPTSTATPIQGDSDALVGRYYLHLGRLKDAQTHCDAAFKTNAANQIAKQCLDDLAVMLADADLNSADAELAISHKEKRGLSALNGSIVASPVNAAVHGRF